MLLFVYFVVFFTAHTTTSRLKSDAIFEFRYGNFSCAIPFSTAFITIMSTHVCSKCINSTPGRKFVTGNKFSDADFLKEGKF